MELSAGMKPAKAELRAKLFHADGRVEDLGVISKDGGFAWKKWLSWILFGLAMYGFLHLVGVTWAWILSTWALGIVTNAGVNYMASDFASGGVTPTISGFKFHDSGTGIVAAAITDTALGTPAGPARVTGTPSNPTVNQYRTIATITYTATLAITEWGLFSASTVGTLWDRRVFTAINVVSGDSIQFTYTLTVNSGGT